METKDLLRATVADFFEVDPNQVGSAFPLNGRLGQGSIARAALDSAIRRRVGLKSKAVYSVATYGELEAALVPGAAGPVPPLAAAPAEAPAPVPSQGPAEPRNVASDSAALACGIDIELIENLPAATDYWTHEFYSTFFTPNEIAYCLLQESPAVHFAGRWCVKEALKKCDPELLAEEMKNIELVPDTAHGPALCRYVGGEARRLPHAVSMSHTSYAAVAIVVKLNESTAPRAAADFAETPAPAPASPPPADAPPRAGGLIAAMSFALSLLALGASLVSLWRIFRT
jgi:phosphopantetheine--protein transferase-like protein